MEHTFEIVCLNVRGQEIETITVIGQRQRACSKADSLIYSMPDCERAKVYLCSVARLPMPMQVLIYEARLPWLTGLA